MLDSEDIYGAFYGDCIAEDELTMEGGSFAGTYNTRYGWPSGSSYMERNRVDLLTQTNNFGHCFGRVHYAIKSLQDYDDYLDIILDNTLFSDPEFSIYVEYPRSFSVTFPSSVSVFELDTLTVTVKDSATQVSTTDAFVTLSKGNEIYERGMSDYAGKTYPVTEPSTTGWIYITVTKPGYTLFVDSIEVVPYCADAVAGDANGDGYVIGSDVSFLTNYFRGLVTPPDSCQCPTNFLYHAADANGDCSVIGSDVTYLLNYFSGGSAPHFCTNCPTGGALLSNLKIIPTERVNSMLNKNSKLNQNDNISPFIKTRENDAAR